MCFANNFACTASHATVDVLYYGGMFEYLQSFLVDFTEERSVSSRG